MPKENKTKFDFDSNGPSERRRRVAIFVLNQLAADTASDKSTDVKKCLQKGSLATAVGG